MAYADKCPVNGNTFPGKLWRLVNNENYPSVRWSSCGTTVIIDAHDFKEEVLRTGEYSIFKTQNFSSFVRQLNLYGFRKLATTATMKFSDTVKNGSHSRSHPLHCFAHEYFIQHRPDILPRVRRTASTTAAAKRRASFGHDSAYYYRQYGNTFRILSRYGQSSASPYYSQPPALSPVSPPSYFYQPISVESRTPCPTQHQLSVPAYSTSGSASPASSSPSAYLSDDADSDAANAEGLAKPCSADVFWGSATACLGASSSEEDQELDLESPSSSPRLTLIAKADKGTVRATRINEEVVAFPSCLYDTKGRLQKFVVIQKSPKVGSGLPNTSSLAPYAADHLNTGPALNPYIWPSGPAVSSSHYNADVGPDSFGCNQLADYASLQYPYVPVGYTAAYPQDYVYLPVYSENAVQGSCYISDEGLTVAQGPESPAHHGKVPSQLLSQDSSTDNEGGVEDASSESRPRSPFKKVLVVEQMKSGGSSIPRAFHATGHHTTGRTDDCHSPYPVPTTASSSIPTFIDED